MSEERFDIVFDGEFVAGFASATVADNLATLFKAPPETVARLLAGGTHVLKRNVDRDTAHKYRSAMERAGARALLRAAAPAPGASAPAADGLTVAPTGRELLAAHERREQPAVAVDTSHIELANALSVAADDNRPATPRVPDTSHISIAAAGADLLPERIAVAPPSAPDTSAITLAAPGTNLGPERVAQASAVPDISHLALAPPGAPLEELRTTKRLLTPDTSALELAPPD